MVWSKLKVLPLRGRYIISDSLLTLFFSLRPEPLQGPQFLIHKTSPSDRPARSGHFHIQWGFVSHGPVVHWLVQRFRSERLRVRSQRSATFTPSALVRRQSLPVWPPTLNKTPLPFELLSKPAAPCLPVYAERLYFLEDSLRDWVVMVLSCLDTAVMSTCSMSFCKQGMGVWQSVTPCLLESWMSSSQKVVFLKHYLIFLQAFFYNVT